MDFLEKVKNTVVSVSKKAADKSTDLVEITKIKFALSEKEGEVDKLYKEIGEAIYNAFKNEAEPDEIISKNCEAITEKKNEIMMLRDQLRERKNIRVCASCGCEVPNDSAYCNKCGTKM